MARSPSLALVWTLLGGCTVVSDFKVQECTTDAECTLPTDAPQHCERSVCERGCRDNHHCASIDPRYPICSTVGGECVGLKNDAARCYVSTEYSDATMGRFTADRMTLIGAFMPRVRSSAWLTLQLAADEIGRSAALAHRPLAIVACSDLGADVAFAVPHLQRLGVGAILSPLDASALARVASVVTREGPLLLSPGGYFQAPGGGPGAPAADVVWYIGPSYADAIPAYAPTIRALAARVRAARPESPARIALIASTAEEDAALAARVLETVQIDGQSAVQLQNVDRLHPFTIDDFAEQRARVLGEIADYRPDIIVWFAGGTFDDAAREERATFVLELDSLAAARADFAPIHVLGPRNTVDGTLRAEALASDGFRARTIGVRVDRASDAATVAALSARFDAAFPNALATSLALRAAPNIYDALYYSAYALAATQQRGISLRTQLLRASTEGAAVIRVGPGDLELAVPLLSSATPFVVVGASGPLLFNAADGARSASARVYCWNAAAELEDLAEYQREAGTFSPMGGACPAGVFDAGG